MFVDDGGGDVASVTDNLYRDACFEESSDVSAPDWVGCDA